MNRKFAIGALLLLAILAGIAWYLYRIPPGPAANYDELEPVVLSITSSLGSFLILSLIHI